MDISRKTAAFVDEYREVPDLSRHIPISGNGASDET